MTRFRAGVWTVPAIASAGALELLLVPWSHLVPSLRPAFCRLAQPKSKDDKRDQHKEASRKHLAHETDWQYPDRDQRNGRGEHPQPMIEGS